MQKIEGAVKQPSKFGRTLFYHLLILFTNDFSRVCRMMIAGEKMLKKREAR